MTAPGVIAVRVYYEDTDLSGAVYHAAYLKFFERGRTELLRDNGIHHAALAEQGLAFAVTEMDVRFVAAARIDDMLDVTTTPSAIKGARMHLEQAITRAGKPVATARVTVVAIRIGGGAARLPQAVLAAFGTER